METSDWISIGAAVIAVATAYFANRRTKEANGTAAQALVVARDARADTAKSRLTANAPKVRVSPGQVEWPPLRRVTVTADSPGLPYPGDTTFHTPRDNDEQIGLRFQVELRNEGATAEVGINGSVSPNDSHFLEVRQNGRITLQAGTTEVITFEEYRPLTDWITVFKQRATGQPGTVDLIAWFGCDDGHDEGVIVSTAVRVTCIGLAPVQNVDSAWNIPGHGAAVGVPWPPTRVFVEPSKTTYWASKLRNEPADFVAQS
ncbi:hypothetical protein KNE206_44670 [Kitasatospora sp. NE20-6]|uniref:hypothetical protein n=1 Tax=Kitasatospora sp. NE20-6 TaxID=2859066 RepID=UPI0034DCC178